MGNATQRKNITLELGGGFNVVVNVESALEGSTQVALNNLCVGPAGGPEHGPVQTRQTLACPACNNSDKDSFAKGKDQGAGRFVVVPQDVLEAAGAEGAKSAGIKLSAHPREQVGRSLNGDKCYFLVPASAASSESYALVAAAIANRPDLSFVTCWAVRSAPAMYQIDVLDGRLVMKQLAWPGAVRALPEVPTVYNDKFMDLANTLIDTMVSDYTPEDYVDGKAKVIQDYLATADTVAGAQVDEAAPAAGAPVDLAAGLMAALESLGGKPPVQPMPADAPANVTRIGAPAKKAAAKKATTTPRKTAVKKTAAKTA